MYWKRLAFIFLLAGTIAWNAFILGWLNHGSAGYIRMSISELNVIGQPHYLFFTVTELLSGIFLAIGGLLLIPNKHKSFLAVLIAGLICFTGLLTIYDSSNPLDCNQYNNPVCAQKDDKGLVSLADKHHNTESTITDYETGALALLTIAFFYVVKADKRLLYLLSFSTLAVVISLAILEFDSSVFTDAIAERVWNLFISVDFLVFGLYYLDNKFRLNKSFRWMLGALPH